MQPLVCISLDVAFSKIEDFLIFESIFPRLGVTVRQARRAQNYSGWKERKSGIAWVTVRGRMIKSHQAALQKAWLVLASAGAHSSCICCPIHQAVLRRTDSPEQLHTRKEWDGSGERVIAGRFLYFRAKKKISHPDLTNNKHCCTSPRGTRALSVSQTLPKDRVLTPSSDLHHSPKFRDADSYNMFFDVTRITQLTSLWQASISSILFL